MLTVIEVLEEVPPEMEMAVRSSDLKDFRKLVRKESSDRLRMLIAPISEEGINITSSILWGTPFIEIIREVIRNNRDLVMLSPRKEGRIKEMLLGSRIMHLMRKCPCPVWAVKPTGSRRYTHIIAAVDVVPVNEESSTLNTTIMELASSLSETENSMLHIVHCWVPYYERTSHSRFGFSQDVATKMIHDTKNLLKKWLDELVKKVDLTSIKYKVHLLEGEPGDLIVQQAKNHQADLVVMGTVSRTGISGFFIGNTAEKILHKLNCSVLAIKPEGFVTPVTLD